jgi:hypothetical protein
VSRSAYIYLITSGYSNDPVGAYTVKYEAQGALRDLVKTWHASSLLITVFRHGEVHKELSVDEFLGEDKLVGDKA